MLSFKILESNHLTHYMVEKVLYLGTESMLASITKSWHYHALPFYNNINFHVFLEYSATWPPSITELTFRDLSFSQPLDDLPPNLVLLCLSNSFNHPVDCLPASLSELNITNWFSGNSGLYLRYELYHVFK